MFALCWSYTAFLGGILFLVLYKYMTRNFDYFKKKNVYYLKPVPFLGNILSAFSTEGSIGEWFQNLYNKTDDNYFGIFWFDKPVLVVKDPKMIKAILQKDFSNFEDRSAHAPQSDPVFSSVLFLKKQPGWKPMRSRVSPVFTSGKLKLMFPLIEGETKEMIKYLYNLGNIPDLETKEMCAKFTTNVICRVAFGLDAEAFKYEDAELRQLGRRMFSPSITTGLRQLAIFCLPHILIDTFNINQLGWSVTKDSKRILRDILKVRKAAKRQIKGHDLVNILLEGEENNDFTDDEILGLALQFFVAGFKTTSTTLSFVLYELCISPEIQKKLRSEIVESVQKNNGITYDSLHEMKYLDMCILEALRKYPIPFLDRRCKENYTLPDSDLVIDKGMAVYIPLYALHYDSKYFPNPYNYDPERFSNKNEINKDGLYYLPFGEGPRMCIGNRFGLMTVKIALAAILLSFKLEKSSKTPIPVKFSSKNVFPQAAEGLPLKFVLIEKVKLL